MNIKIRYHYLDYSGKKRQKTITHDFPDFKDSTEYLRINGKNTEVIVEAELKIHEHLASIDKTDIMDEFGMWTILDFEVALPKKKKEELPEIAFIYGVEHIKHLFEGEVSDQVLTDMIAIAQNNREVLEGLTIKKQFQVVNAILLNSYRYGTETLKIVNKILKEAMTADDPQKLIEEKKALRGLKHE